MSRFMLPRLRGDGRFKIKCNPHAPGHDVILGNPMQVRLAIAKSIVQNFQDGRYSNHSARGSLVWVIQEWCHLNNVPYRIARHGLAGNTGGYQIWREGYGQA